MTLSYLVFQKVKQVRNSFHIIIPRNLRSITLDILDIFTKPQRQLVAPLKLRHTLGQDQEYNGDALVQSLRDLCRLQPQEKILDVGSGCGRIALSLTKYLNKKGSYQGLEIVKEFVDWCQENISSSYPNFRFTHANICNSSYNPKGTFKASQYRFPYDDKSFDVVILSSVFTHMLLEDLENYLSEISRVMKNGGRCWISYFLLDTESQRFTNENRTRVSFVDMGGYFVADLKIPESAVAYKEEMIIRLYERNMLEIIPPIHYGSGGQDLIVAKKRVS